MRRRTIIVSSIVLSSAVVLLLVYSLIFPGQAKVQSVSISPAVDDPQHVWLQYAGWEYNPECSYYMISYTVDVKNYSPFMVEIANLAPVSLPSSITRAANMSNQKPGYPARFSRDTVTLRMLVEAPAGVDIVAEIQKARIRYYYEIKIGSTYRQLPQFRARMSSDLLVNQ